MIPSFKEGDRARITGGVLAGFDCIIDEVIASKQLLRVIVHIFNHSVAVELEYWQAEPV